MLFNFNIVFFEDEFVDESTGDFQCSCMFQREEMRCTIDKRGCQSSRRSQICSQLVVILIWQFFIIILTKNSSS